MQTLMVETNSITGGHGLDEAYGHIRLHIKICGGGVEELSYFMPEKTLHHMTNYWICTAICRLTCWVCCPLHLSLSLLLAKVTTNAVT